MTDDADNPPAFEMLTILIVAGHGAMTALK